VTDKNLLRFLRWWLHGQIVEEAEQRQKRGSPRKREPEAPAEPGTLRSGKSRGVAADAKSRKRT
jgi:hypothetical protein